MLKLFQYNWQVRDDWFTWCKDVPEEELLKKRVGGVGSILYTLFHIVDVEWAWITLDLRGEQVPKHPTFEEYSSLQKVLNLSRQYRGDVEPYVRSWTSEMESKIFSENNPNGETENFKYGEIMRHVIAHEIHHIGQLSIWSRELGKKPVTANLIRRGLFDN
ncbi:putative damage-inducible protein DinB [Peribacillus huizhouensis]|uniref:Damage-inducible protein DinB n=2 Tax=Peribacillus huizhouensis TaxID=1501239 RepID=A0ABR6CWT7_9BACI|nr:DinB family protein [Peribacillus huizhouensis]MBA9029085.1 putative damage-inducible protein DinB [Peribacillus huizhouensis]